MDFRKLPSKSKKLLDEILESDNPTDMLSKRFDSLSQEDVEELRDTIRELHQAGYISVDWAGNKPYRVITHNSARAYDEQLAEYEAELANQRTIRITDQSVKIGDHNKISNSIIAGKIEAEEGSTQPICKRSFFDRHPIICAFLISLVAGIVLLFSFWEKIIVFLEGLF